MRLVGHGHPNVRATHDKTLELTRDASITARASCVVGVGPLSSAEPLAPMAGPVRITVTAGAGSATVDAIANSAWDPADGLVVRRGPLRLPGTFAVTASAAASDLPRALVAAMRDPAAKVEWSVQAVPADEAWLVLLFADPALAVTPQLRAELAAADVVVAEDEAARRLVDRAGFTASTSATGSAATGHDATGSAATGHDAGRTLVIATAELPGSSLDRSGFDAMRVDVIGLPPLLAAVAASPGDGPVLLAGDERPADVLRSTPVTARIALSVERAAAAAILADAVRLRGSSGAVAVEPFGSPVRLSDGDVPRFSSSPVAICLDAQTESTALDPRIDAAVRALLDEGTPTRAVARALAELTGRSRRAAYDEVIRHGARKAAGT